MREDRENKWQPTSPPVRLDEFYGAIEASRVVIHFWAPWNPYDRQLDANLQSVIATYAKKFRFYAVNADETPFAEVMETYHVGALPALLCFTNGKVKGRFYGVETVEALKTFLDEMCA